MAKVAVGNGACFRFPATEDEENRNGGDGSGGVDCSASVAPEGTPRARPPAPEGASPRHKEEEGAEGCRSGALSAFPDMCFSDAKGLMLSPSEMPGGGALCWRLVKKPVLGGGEGATRFPLPSTTDSSAVSSLLVMVLYEAVGVAVAVAEDLWLFSAAWALFSLVGPVGPGKGTGKEGIVSGILGAGQVESTRMTLDSVAIAYVRLELEIASRSFTQLHGRIIY